jgi:Amt family ammonium transporter
MFNAADTVWILLSAGLVMLMIPGLAFFYGGLGSRKNVISIMTNSIFNMGVGTFLWVVVGFTLTCGGPGLFVGPLDFIFHNGIEMEDMTGTLPTYAYSALMMMYALITPMIISGSISGRMRFKAFFIFVIAWSLVVYYPLAHMVWGEGGLLGAGWLQSVDFAGGNVVHISSGVSGLILCVLVGRRRGYSSVPHRPHNIPFILLGLGILWFGWFGFNGGSALEASSLTSHVFLATAIAGGCAMFSWTLIEIIRTGKPTIVGACTGALAGLVGITPGCGFMPIWAAVIVGLLVAPACYFGIILVKKVLKIDDSLDAFGCHGIGGIVGGLATGLFALASVGGVDGLFFGNPEQLGRQAAAIAITIAWAGVGTLIAAGVARIFSPLRATPKDELSGLDRPYHDESAYPSFNGLD